MAPLLKVVSVKASANHSADVRFSNGDEGRADLSWIVSEDGEMLKPLKDQREFMKVFLSSGSLTWPNGFAIDTTQLHHEMSEAGAFAHAAA